MRDIVQSVHDAICFSFYLRNLPLFKHNWNFEKKKNEKIIRKLSSIVANFHLPAP